MRSVSRIRLSASQKEIFVDVAKYILLSLLAGVALAIILSDPKSLFKIYEAIKKKNKNASYEDVERIVQKLKKDRFFRIIYKNGNSYLKVTEKGKRYLVEFNIDTISIQQQKWDGRWRIVIFDIPEKMRIARDVLRDRLEDIGFIKIQKSVWVCPYECEDEINFISSTYEVGDFVNYIIATKVDFDKFLKTKFNL